MQGTMRRSFGVEYRPRVFAPLVRGLEGGILLPPNFRWGATANAPLPFLGTFWQNFSGSGCRERRKKKWPEHAPRAIKAKVSPFAKRSKYSHNYTLLNPEP